MTELKTEGGNITTYSIEINRVIRQYYEQLYTQQGKVHVFVQSCGHLTNGRDPKGNTGYPVLPLEVMRILGLHTHSLKAPDDLFRPYLP